MVGIALRFLYLGADPYYHDWNGYITDEGRWIDHARALTLFGAIDSVGSRLHLMIAPLFQAAAFAIFALFDASFWSARVVSAVGGSAVLAAFWAVYRRVASPEALLLVLAMLAVEMDLVALSRLAIPEMAAMSLSLGAFLLILGDHPGRPRLVVAGLLTAAAVGMKATVLPVVPIFAAVVLARRPAPAIGAHARRRARVLRCRASRPGSSLPERRSSLPGGLPRSRGPLRVVRSFAGFTGLNDLLALPFDGTVGPCWGSGGWWHGWDSSAASRRRRARTRPRADTLPRALLWAGLFALGHVPPRLLSRALQDPHPDPARRA